MNEEKFSAAALPASEAEKQSRLVSRIAWLCQCARFAALAYALWVLFEIIKYWTDIDTISRGYGRFLNVDLSDMSLWQLAAGLLINILIWLFAAYACYAAWLLFSNYLKGQIFTAESAAWLRRIALFGLISVMLGILSRPLVSLVLTAHLAQGKHMVNVFFHPEDLLNMLLLGGLLALSRIQKSAADIAGENAQFV